MRSRIRETRELVPASAASECAVAEWRGPLAELDLDKRSKKGMNEPVRSGRARVRSRRALRCAPAGFGRWFSFRTSGFGYVTSMRTEHPKGWTQTKAGEVVCTRLGFWSRLRSASP